MNLKSHLIIETTTMEQYKKLLRDHYVSNTDKQNQFTHVSLVQPKGSFRFSHTDFEKLWTTYCDLVEGCDSEDVREGRVVAAIVGLAEKPGSCLPVLADVDLKLQEHDDFEICGDHIYTLEQVVSLIKIYQSVLREIIDGCDDESLMCVLLEKPMRRITRNGVTSLKSGFHLHFPSMFIDKADQLVQLIPRVQNIVRNKQVFKDIVEDSGSVIDKAVCNNPWLLYGSRKDEESEPYLVSRCFNSEAKEISLDAAFKYYRIFDTHDTRINIRAKSVNYYLPRILSTNIFGRNVSEVKPELISPLKKTIREKPKPAGPQMNTSQSLDIARTLLQMISDRRAEDRNDWMTIGWVLYNIGQGCEEAMNIWIDFSKRAEDKFDETACIFEWEGMKEGTMSLGTLHHYANSDSPEAYAAYKRERANAHIDKTLNGAHNDIAKLMYNEYGNEFKCASIVGKTWYQFNGHKWDILEEGVELSRRISGPISEIYMQFLKEMDTDFSSKGRTDDKGAQAGHDARKKQLLKIIGNLKNNSFKNAVMRECMEVFYDKNFKPNLNPNIIGFKNGVYDLIHNVFRPGRPEDYLTKSMPINFVDFAPDDERVLEVHNFFEKIFPDRELREYFLDKTCDVFTGGNSEKIAMFWVGDGDNGKTITQTFFEKMLGPYAIKCSTMVLTGKKPLTGCANPDLARMGDGVRWSVFEEANGDEMVNSGIFKTMSGNDSYFARDLFEKGKDAREIIPLFKITFICNKLPSFRYPDKATFNRVRVIKFESTFCHDAPDTFEEQLKQKRFPIDCNFSSKIPGLLEPLAWVLLEHRKKPKSDRTPDKVIVATETYRRRNDIYRQFLMECIIESKSGSVDGSELYAVFKDWFREGYTGQSMPSKNDVLDQFVALWGESTNGRWKGFKVKTEKDRIESGDILIVPAEELCVPPI